MAFSGLIPFIVLLVSFAGLRLPLAHSSFLSLLAGTLLTQTLFHASSEVWGVAVGKTAQMMVEIGLILLGAFFFLEVAKRTGIIDSLAQLIRTISPNRLIQAVLVTFPLALMVEGSSGFGTPLLVIAPILTLFLLTRRPPLKIVFWTLSLSTVYFFSGRPFAESGPELAALGPAFLTLIWGLISTRLFLKSKETSRKFELKGVALYGLLLIALWLGKRTFMDQLIPGTSVRIFNPGFVFLLFGSFLIPMHPRLSFQSVIVETLHRSKRTLAVLFCMTFLVQQLRANGALELLTRSLPSFLLGSGSPFLGWMGSILIGTSTMANLLLSKVVDPTRYVSIAGGSAIGVQLAFQSVVAMKSILHDRLSEKQIYRLILPVSLGYILLLSLL